MSHPATPNRPSSRTEGRRSPAIPSLRLVSGCVLPLLLAAPALAQATKPIADPALDSATMKAAYVAPIDTIALPSLDQIDAQTDIAIFLHPDVPDEMRLPALRRAWSVNPAIRDFKGLAELDWDFTAANSAFGFAELTPGPQVEQMLAQILDGTPMATDKPAITVAFVRDVLSPSTVGLARGSDPAASCTKSTAWGRIVSALLFCWAR